MSDKTSNIFDRHNIPQTPKLTIIDGGKSSVTKEPYQAYRLDTPESQSTRIRIEHADEHRTVCSLAKGCLIEWRAQDDRYLSLIFTTTVIMMEGQNLIELLKKLDEGQVSHITCYSPLFHLQPDDKETIILSLEQSGLHELAAS